MNLFQHQRETQMKCPHCGEEVCEGEPKVSMGEEAFHRNCWIRKFIRPAEEDTRAMTVRQEADAAVSAWEKRRALDLM